MKSLLISILFLLSGITYSFSQGLFEKALQNKSEESSGNISLNGYVRGSAFGASEKYDYSALFGEVSLQGHLSKNNLFLHSDIRFRSGSFFNRNVTDYEVKEAYAGIGSNVVDVFLGNQIVSWGRTDGFNPTNNINPNNYFFLSANTDDQKLSNFMLRTKIRFTPQICWEVIGIPLFMPSEYRYDLLEIYDNATFSDAVLPDRVFKNGSLATKLNFEFSKIGFSLSWFNGYDPFYGFDIKNVDFSTGMPLISYIPSFYRKNCVGLDFSFPVGTWIFKGELAGNLPENNENKIYIPNSDIAYVAGIEHDFKGFMTIVQYIGKYTLNYNSLVLPVLTDPSNPMALMQYAQSSILYESELFNRKIFHQQEEYNHALSLIIRKSFAYETLNLELVGYYDLTSEEYLVRPSISWNITNSLSATAGYSYMSGPDNSIFKYTSPIMSGGFIELKASF